MAKQTFVTSLNALNISRGGVDSRGKVGSANPFANSIARYKSFLFRKETNILQFSRLTFQKGCISFLLPECSERPFVH
jgi:hypothetical protein